MIPPEKKRDVFSSGAEGSASFEISSKDTAHIMTILRDTLYSDKVMAVLREYSANAWDANRVAGKADVPIEVSLPTIADLTLRIRDRGAGLSMDDVFKVYTQYGASTKREDNEGVGMLGIGSKSGFAYSDSFTVVSWHEGSRATYVAVIDDSEKGRIDLLDVQDCDPSETGVEIQIPIRPGDLSEFDTKARQLYRFFVPAPKINAVIAPLIAGEDFDGLGRVFDPTAGGRGDWTAVMGCIGYRINLGQLRGLSGSVHSIGGVVHFGIGDLQVAASREELKYSDGTKEILTKRINELIDAYVARLLQGVDKLSEWERRLRVKQIKNLYLPVPKDLSGYEDSYVTIRAPMGVFKLRSRGWRGKLGSTTGVSIVADARIVFRDERRHMSGYAFNKNDVIVDPPSVADIPAARRALRTAIQTNRIGGIPQIDISKLPWTKPATARTPVDTARMKAECLVLDPRHLFHDRKSQRWIPATRVPSKDDVYVVLHSYQAVGMDHFYEDYESDRSVVEAAGLKMPDVIGYRDTVAKPVDKAKLLGQDYRDWRKGDLIRMLMAVPGVKTAVEARIWNDVYHWGLTEAAAKRVGLDHPIGKFIMRVVNAGKENSKTKPSLIGIVNRVTRLMIDSDREPSKEWQKILETYPLLKVAGSVAVFEDSGDHIDLWVDYVKLIDSLAVAAADGGGMIAA